MVSSFKQTALALQLETKNYTCVKTNVQLLRQRHDIITNDVILKYKQEYRIKWLQAAKARSQDGCLKFTACEETDRKNNSRTANRTQKIFAVKL